MMDRLEESQPSDSQYEHRFHNRRMSDQKLEILTNSPVAKLISWFITVVFLPITAWGLLTLLSEVRQLNEAIAKNNTVSAIFDLRITTLEQLEKQREQQLEALSKKDTEHDTRLTILEQTVRNPRDQSR